MIQYDLGPGVEAASTNIGDPAPHGIVTPAFQAHSTRSAIIPRDLDATHGVDALITAERGIAIGVRTADCVPILIYDCLQRVVAAIHSGWKGTVANIIGATINRMHDELRCDPGNMRALIGPCIHLDAFEVGDEVYEAFKEAGYEAHCKLMRNPMVEGSAVKWHVSLPDVCAEQLSQCGVRDVTTRKECTFVNHSTLYSYRRDSSLTSPSQRIITYIRLI